MKRWRPRQAECDTAEHAEILRGLLQEDGMREIVMGREVTELDIEDCAREGRREGARNGGSETKRDHVA